MPALRAVVATLNLDRSLRLRSQQGNAMKHEVYLIVLDGRTVHSVHRSSKRAMEWRNCILMTGENDAMVVTCELDRIEESAWIVESELIPV